MKYRVTHKGRDCKDDMKLFKYADSKSKSSLLPWMWFLNGLFDDLAKKRKKVLVALNYEYKGTDSINSIQLSLKITEKELICEFKNQK